MSNIEPFQPPSLVAVSRPDRVFDRMNRTTARSLQTMEHHTTMRLATVQSDGIVQAEKLREVDRLAETAMTGQAMLAKWRETLAGADPMLQDELRFFSDVARMGKGEVIIDTIAALRRK